MKMGHFAAKNNTKSKKKLISVCKAIIFTFFSFSAKHKKCTWLPFAKWQTTIKSISSVKVSNSIIYKWLIFRIKFINLV